ncbi:MAG: hypothetical protein EHM59_12025 [Betaproteobacteria bacterium]|nr:MAG: hypothetical protein EHM59_12025 [Betaproteobacteria bacterium]
MRWLALLLLFANIAVGGYQLLIAPGSRAQADVRALELNPDQVKVIRSGAQNVAPAAMTKPSSGACLEWGGFSASDLERARSELAKLQINNVSVRELEPEPAWWVHIAPLKSREEAERRVRELEELGIKNARVVTEERSRNAISLGTFQTEAAALDYQQRMREAKVRNVLVAQRDDRSRRSVIVIADATPALAGRLVELKMAFAGSDLKAVACAVKR